MICAVLTAPLDVSWGRRELAEWLATGCHTGAEIGVERGRYSEVVCRANPTGRHYAIDTWQTSPGYRSHVTQAQLDTFHAETVQRLAPFPGAVVLRSSSLEAAQGFADGALDYVYLDAAHDYLSVIADLEAWTPKVRSAGVIAGHDYVARSGCEVIQAVTDYTKAYRIAPLYVLTGDRSPSWLWVKA